MTETASHRPSGPIAVFDSGIGGLSVWREIVRILPHEATLYLADQAHVPYGARPVAEVERLTHAAVAWLLRQGAKLIVIACNTASAAALTSLRQRWPEVPIVGMEPAVKPASQATQTGHVGVLATPGTLQASRFSHLVERFANGVQVHTLMGSGLVEMVERNQLSDPQTEARIREILAPVQGVPMDHLVLGCTHFPFLAAMLHHVLGDGVTLVDPAPAVARQTQRVLARHGLQSAAEEPGAWRFVTTGDSERFRATAASLLSTLLDAPRRPVLFEQTAVLNGNQTHDD